MTNYPTPYNWRPMQPQDAPAIRETLLAALKIDGLESVPSLEEMQLIFDQLGGDITTDTLVAITADQTIAAFVLAFMPPSGEEHVVQVNGHVAVDHRRRGLGTFLMQWVETRARQKVHLLNDNKPRRIQLGCREQQSDYIALFEKCGFQPVRYFYKMQRDLAQPIPEKPLANGLTLANWQPYLDYATMTAFNDSFRDHWNFFPADETIWKRWFTGRPDFRGDLTYLALDGDNVAGFCLGLVREGEIQQTRRKEAWMADIGTVRAWRKKGVASSLIVAAMHGFKAAGMEYAVLGVDTQNPSGALSLYEGLGFTAVRRNITFSKDIE